MKHQIGCQTLILGDCVQGLQAMADDCVDVVVTSPPYNIGIDYGTYDDKRPRESYLTWLEVVAAECSRVLRPGGSVFLNVGFTGPDPWLASDVANVFRKFLRLQNNIAWVKSVAVGETTYGHFKPISSARYLNNTFEMLFHFSHDGSAKVDRLAIGVPFMDKSNIRRRAHAADRRCAGNVWFVPYDTVKSAAGKHNHPAGYPTALVARCLAFTGLRSGVVLDPFGGAGTTAVAAALADWSSISFEIDKAHFETACSRVQNTPQL